MLLELTSQWLGQEAKNLIISMLQNQILWCITALEMLVT